MHAHTNVPQGQEADAVRAARVFEEPQPARNLREYINPSHIANEFKTFTFDMVVEIWNVEVHLRGVVNQARDPIYKITFVDEELIGAPHSKWTAITGPSGIDEMTLEEKDETLKVAQHEVHFLRKESVQLQKIMYNRRRFRQRGESFKQLPWPAKSRPADGTTELYQKLSKPSV
jgi:hypothetical protein